MSGKIIPINFLVRMHVRLFHSINYKHLPVVRTYWNDIETLKITRKLFYAVSLICTDQSGVNENPCFSMSNSVSNLWCMRWTEHVLISLNLACWCRILISLWILKLMELILFEMKMDCVSIPIPSKNINDQVLVEVGVFLGG